MFSLGFGEILVICVILILVVGPERLPAVMKGVGKTMRTVREASREIRTTVGLDELMRDDPPRPIYRPPPPATVARVEPLPASTEASAPAASAPAASAPAANVTEANAAPASGAQPPPAALAAGTAVADVPAAPAAPPAEPVQAGSPAAAPNDPSKASV
jgi:sec-independent protein translocase protein TatB